MEPVSPVVVDHRPVVGLDGEDEGDQVLVVVSLHAEQISEHEESLADLVQVCQSSCVVRKSREGFQ